MLWTDAIEEGMLSVADLTGRAITMVRLYNLQPAITMVRRRVRSRSGG